MRFVYARPSRGTFSHLEGPLQPLRGASLLPLIVKNPFRVPFPPPILNTPFAILSLFRSSRTPSDIRSLLRSSGIRCVAPFFLLEQELSFPWHFTDISVFLICSYIPDG